MHQVIPVLAIVSPKGTPWRSMLCCIGIRSQVECDRLIALPLKFSQW